MLRRLKLLKYSKITQSLREYYKMANCKVSVVPLKGLRTVLQSSLTKVHIDSNRPKHFKKLNIIYKSLYIRVKLSLNCGEYYIILIQFSKIAHTNTLHFNYEMARGLQCPGKERQKAFRKGFWKCTLQKYKGVVQ